MASVSFDRSTGHRTIQFVVGENKPGVKQKNYKRRSIRLGKVTQKHAETVKLRVEALNAALVARVPWDVDTASWVASIGDDLADKLAAVGLIPARGRSTVGEFVAAYIAKRTDVKPRTVINLRWAEKHLVAFFGSGKALKEVSPGDCDGWLLWLKERYSDATSGRALKRGKQFFRAAIRARLLTANPFDDIKPPSQNNESRKAFVSKEAIEKVLATGTDAEWRLVVALARYGGLRIPSELLPLTWDDVLWDEGKFLVRSPKTEHHEGGAERWVPIFPELRPWLEQAFEAAPEGAVHLVNRYRDGGQNLRTRLLKNIKRAGLLPWPRLFQNLRASRETELTHAYPLHVVCAWLGNSPSVASKHYLQVTAADFKRGAESGAEVVQKAVQSQDVPERLEPSGSAQPSEDQEVRRILTALDDYWQSVQIPPRGIETSPYSKGNTAHGQDGGSFSGPLSPGEVAGMLRGLPRRDRDEVADWLRGGQP